MTPLLLVAAAMLNADGNDGPSVELDGHTLKVESTTTAGQTSKFLTITFTVDPKDSRKSVAYEIGQRFVARDAAGKEIPLEPSPHIVFEPAFRLAGYPAPPKSAAIQLDRPSQTPNPLRTVIPHLSNQVDKIATLEGDLFVSEVELLEFK